MIKGKLEAIVRNCQISLFLDEVLIICSNDLIFATLVRHKGFVQVILHKILKEKFFRHITIGTEGKRIGFPVSNNISMPMIQQPSILSTPATSQSDLISECMNYSGACGIIRMSDHKGLFSNGLIVQSSNAHPNDWIGKKMSDWWIEDELNPYLERLTKDKELRNYSYIAKMMSGENAKLTVDARLIIWNGEPARLVKTISREYLA